jgi:serine/threonine-protein kinase
VLSPGEEFEGSDVSRNYVIDEALVDGRYATVYRAHDAAGPDRVVALKILHDRHRYRTQVARLRREFELAHRLDHPHIVTVYECGAGWLSMELISGGGIAGLGSIANRLVALGQIADALDYTHNHAIVHCDVKPANILIRQGFSDAVLIDFGVAEMIADDIGHRPGHVEASLPYSAPELITGHAPSDATDEYALACTAVELITGSPPFTTQSRTGLITAHLHEAPPRRSREIPWLPSAFDSIVAKALAKAPQDRYRSCREFVSLITRALK